MLDKLFCNATIVNHCSRFRANVGTRDGMICYLGTDFPECREQIDLTGRYLLPGCIDSHLHFQDLGYTDREDLEHGSAACAAGGVTTGISMPMNDPPAVDLESYAVSERAYAGRSYIDYALHIGATSENLDRLAELWSSTGAAAVKLFTCFSVSDFPYVQDDCLLRAFEILAQRGGVAMVHAENDAIIKSLEKKLQDEGRNSGEDYLLSHPIIGENEAIQRVLYFAQRTGVETVILHVSNAEALEMIYAARQRGVKVHAESAPHMFAFTQEDIRAQGPYLKFSPVMHDIENQRRMLSLLGKGYVQTIASDHSPYTVEEKERGRKNIWLAPNGIPGVQTSLAVFLNAVNAGWLTLERIAELMSYNPAQIYGLAPEKGEIRVGADADLVAVDMDLVRTFRKEEILSKSKWSPYCGMTLKGWPVMTVVRGEIVYCDGRITGKLGHGKYIKRKK